MIPEPFLPGYLIYLLFIFLPGIGFGELFGIWKLGDTIAERFALSFGLGLAMDTVVLLVKTSGIEGLKGVDASSIYFTILLGLIALIIPIGVRRRFVFPLRPKALDYTLLLIIIIQGIILLLYFQKYPIFPQYSSQDFANHTLGTLDLISGAATSIPGGILYFGVRYQLASAIILVGGEPLVTIQRTMALLITLAPLIFYLAGKRLFSSSRVGLIAAAVYTLSGTLWYSGPLDSGLYPNFFGLLAVLFIPVALYYVIENPKSIGYWLFFLLATINTYMSHYTAVTILPALVALPIIQFITKKPDAKRYIVPILVVLVPAIVPFVIYPGILHYILYLAESGGGLISGGTTLSIALAGVPVLGYMAVEMFDDVEFIVLLILLLFYLYGIAKAKTRPALIFFPLVWFVSLLIAAPQNVSAWRFSYEAIVPLLLMGCYGLALILPGSTKGEKAKVGISKRVKSSSYDRLLIRIIIFLIFIGSVLIGAYAQTVVGDSLSATSTVAQSQINIYNSMYWLKDNTPNNSEYLSVSDWRFQYTNILIDRNSYSTYIYSPAEAIAIAKNISAQYIIVTYLVTLSLPNQKNLFPWNNFPVTSNHNLTLLYTNPDVRIYEINS